MKKNRGFSLIEIIVVIAIMGIVMTGVGVAVFSQSSWKVRQAKDTIFNVMQQTRSECLAKDKAWVKFCYEDDQFVLKTSFGEDHKFGKHVTVSYDYQMGPTANAKAGSVTINSSNSLVLTFKRGTGGFQTMKEDIDANGDFVAASGKGNSPYCRAIHIRINSNSKGYTIYLYPVTGKFELKKD